MHKNKKRTVFSTVCFCILLLFTIVSLFPVVVTLTHSFMGESEITSSYGAVLESGETSSVDFHIFPRMPTLSGYWSVFGLNSHYLAKFWRSLFLSLSIAIGQTAVSCLSAYGFSKFHFPGRRALYFLFVLLMVTPLQVTLVSNYIVLDRMGLIGSTLAVLLPAVFSTFGTFLLYGFFFAIPDSVLEAAELDGAGAFRRLLQVVLPIAKSGIVALFLLSFIDAWNMVEQPLVFLRDEEKYPLSVFLANLSQDTLSDSFVCGILSILPAVVLFLIGRHAMIEGIEGELK